MDAHDVGVAEPEEGLCLLDELPLEAVYDISVPLGSD